MKKILYILLTAIFFISCEKKIIIDGLTTGPSRLVIEADIFWNKDSNNAIQPQTVKLSRSVGFYDREFPAVSTATVTLTNSKNEQLGTFTHTKDGLFVASDFTEPTENEEYTLTIKYDGETFTGKHQYTPITEFTVVKERKQDFFGETTSQINYEFTNEIGVDNFYFVQYDYILQDEDKNSPVILEQDFDPSIHEIVSSFDTGDDEFASDKEGENTVEGVYFFEDDPKEGQEFKITLTSTSERYTTFVTKFLINTGENNGPQDTAPAEIRGNMFNQTDADNYPLGFFAMGQSTSTTYIIGSNIIKE